MCIGVSSKLLQKEQRAVFYILKVYSFFDKKRYGIRDFILKRMQDSVNSC